MCEDLPPSAVARGVDTLRRLTAHLRRCLPASPLLLSFHILPSCRLHDPAPSRTGLARPRVASTRTCTFFSRGILGSEFSKRALSLYQIMACMSSIKSCFVAVSYFNGLTPLQGDHLCHMSIIIKKKFDLLRPRSDLRTGGLLVGSLGCAATDRKRMSARTTGGRDR